MVQLSKRQCDAARGAGFDYIWVINLEDGSQLAQFDEAGEECAAPKHLLMAKEAGDLYPHSAVFTGVKSACLISVWAACSPVWVGLSEGEDLVLFRRIYDKQGVGVIQKIYAIGKRRGDIEHVIYACPTVNEDGFLPTLIEFSSDPDFTVSYERGLQVAGEV